MRTNEELVDYLAREGVLKTPRIVNAFRKIDRADFVPERLRDIAYEDAPLPIGWGATISQPYVVAFMLELLAPKPGDKILDIGSGSGWTTALLAYIAGPKGRVFAIERVPELKEFGEKNCAKYNFVEKSIVKFICADGTKGLAAKAPFDAIHAAASASKDLPAAWKRQLKTGGRIAAPVGDSVWRFIKKSGAKFAGEEYRGFVFVPLVGK